MGKVFGIDLGTTYSCIAYIDENGKPVVLKNAEGDLTTPSAVFFETQTDVTVGSAAKESAKMYPEQVVTFIKGDKTGRDNAVQSLCGLCVVIFKDVASKKKYDTFANDLYESFHNCKVEYRNYKLDFTKYDYVIAITSHIDHATYGTIKDKCKNSNTKFLHCNNTNLFTNPRT